GDPNRNFKNCLDFDQADLENFKFNPADKTIETQSKSLQFRQLQCESLYPRILCLTSNSKWAKQEQNTIWILFLLCGIGYSLAYMLARWRSLK
ncbi:unnamed protein product, partial [Hymenolepis diminuta]